MSHQELKICGAKTRSGGECARFAIKGKNRCDLHGGKSTGPKKGIEKSKKNATTHGFYTDALKKDEKELWERVEIGSIDDEIKLMRIKVFRLVKLAGDESLQDLIDAAIEITRKQGDDPRLGAFDKTEIKVRAPQYADLIFAGIAEIRKLEMQRLQMMQLKKELDADDADDNSHIRGFDLIDAQ